MRALIRAQTYDDETSSDGNVVFTRTLISPDWIHTATGMTITAGIATAVSRTVPNGLSLILMVLSVGSLVLAHSLRRFEPYFEKSPGKSYLLMAGVVGVPMLLYGMAVASWSFHDPAFYAHYAVATLIAISTLAIICLQGRLPSMLTAMFGVWTGYMFVGYPQLGLFVALIGAIGQFWLVSLHHSQNQDRRLRAAEITKVQERAEELLTEYENTGQGWFWETDRRGMITYVSKHIARQLNKTADELIGTSFLEIFVLDSDERESERTLNFHLSTRSSFQDLPVQAATGEKDERWWSISGKPILDKFNNYLGFRGWGTDLTEKRNSQRHVTQLARFDSLTKLANRFQMSEWLEKILGSAQHERRACAILLLDLDRFKQVNDTMGHPMGDALLKQVAERISATVGKHGSVGRLGGDEFQIILPGRHSAKDIAYLADRIIENLSQPYSVSGSRLTIGASIGVSVCPDHGTTSEELIRNADLALYAAKDGGRGRHHFYASDLHSEAEERRQLEQDLRDAIANGELELYYQPQVSTTTEKISGFEALLRWKHPEHGFLSPAKFIPIAEDTGLIAPIGEWALRTACHTLASWPDSVRVAVNVSPIQFADPALTAIVTSAIASSGIDPARLELEITESVFLNDDRSTEQMFASLKGIGVRLALDDFGTGYSSLGYLKKAPFDKIKIDQSFVRGATIGGNRNGAIIAAIVSLAESLGMETTAEGVEMLDELDLIRDLGCSHIQGYIYEKPMTELAASELLSSGLKAIARGPRSARSPRQTMLRKVLIEHGGRRYQGTIRNVSRSGALIEGLWNVPAGTEFRVHLSKGFAIAATARWSKQDRMGVEFQHALELDDTDRVILNPVTRNELEQPMLRKAS